MQKQTAKKKEYTNEELDELLRELASKGEYWTRESLKQAFTYMERFGDKPKTLFPFFVRQGEQK